MKIEQRALRLRFAVAIFIAIANIFLSIDQIREMLEADSNSLYEWLYLLVIILCAALFSYSVYHDYKCIRKRDTSSSETDEE